MVEASDPNDNDEPYDPKKECETPKVDWEDILQPKLKEATTFAFTINAPNFKTITICPWFLDYAAKNSLKSSYSFKTWQRSKLLRLFRMDKRVTTSEFTKVDFMSLFDKTLLHEVRLMIHIGPDLCAN